MSLPTDIIQFLGPGSVPVVVFGTVLAVFELGDKFASQQAKDALSKWLRTFDIRKAKVLPDGTKELFERIFGERHFSLKCFVRSAVFSLGALAFISIVRLLIDPHPLKVFFPGEEQVTLFWFDWTGLILWVLWSIVIDYVSLYKTRLVLTLLFRLHQRTMVFAIGILVVDYIAYKFLFGVGMGLVPTLPDFIMGANVWGTLTANLELEFRYILGPPEGLPLIFFWSGFGPSLWMWLYVLALFVTRLLLRSEKLVNWLRWALDVEKNPFRSIGAVAATLAFIGSLVIILGSAEVSWISRALSG